MCQAETGGKVTHQLLLFKAVAIVSNHGGLRVQEAFRLRYSDVKEKSDGIWITFKPLKTCG